ncbi:malate dehydrogenase, mitochondrial-like [Ctenocephalides felis]|uniref:malate dehydrogenase, mitochondrial-like n=1 Tax=Ctenocephalides felis TaxID=7515 RepID=UPI000E6E5091|nr:malate dehydrogenase, mitochondrial-like [Ctenocephalides felis]
MLSRILKPLLNGSTRAFSTTNKNNVKVAVLGAAGGIGQPLSLLLKQSPLISRLNLYDILGTIGVAADLSHIETPAKVCGYNGKKFLCKALEGVDVVVIPAGSPRKPGMTRDDLFDINASIVAELIEACANTCPKAIIGIITNPVNSVVPIACEIMMKHKKFDPRKIFGITTLDLCRANTFIAEMNDWDPMDVDIPVIGGHAGATIIPLLSHCRPPVKMSDKQAAEFCKRVQEAGTEVVKAKEGAGSATLSMAFAATRFALKMARALKGEQNVTECAYVYSDVVPDIKYFANPVVLGKEGMEKNLGLPALDTAEKKLLDDALPQLKKEIEKGIVFAQKFSNSS